jgi:predicted metal-dependent phosphoesterase TrpH
MLSADLHLHTIASDGRKTYHEVIDMAVEKQLTHIALTNHDTVEELDEAMTYAKTQGLTVIPGMELSTVYHGHSVHVLAYFKQDGHRHRAIQDYGVNLKASRIERAQRMCEKLKEHYDLDLDIDVLWRQANGVVARPHMAATIVHHYPQYTYEEVFEKFLGNDSKAYIPTTKMSLADGLAFLKEHDALAICAHPGLLQPDCMEEILAHPFDGLEYHYPRHTEAQKRRFKALIEKNQWLSTAGSDYHGIPNDSKHGMIGDCRLEGDALQRFLDALNR